MHQPLAETELDRLATLCGSLHLHSRDSDIADHLLAPIASALSADSAAYRHLRLQPARPCIVNLTSLGVPRSVSDDYLSHFHRFDPFLDRLRARPAETRAMAAGSAHRAPDSRPDVPAGPLMLAQDGNFPDLESFRLYCHDFLYPNGLVHHAGFFVSDPCRRHAWVFNFHRPASAPQFSALELARSRMIAACLQGQAHNPEPAVALTCQQDTDKLSTLTTRELDIVNTVAQGLANKQIADSLGISPRTVENHLRNIYDKLHINTRTQLLSMLHHKQHYNPDRTDSE